MIEADIATLKEISPAEVAEYDLVGVGSPIWFFRETANVRQFMNQLPSLDGKLGFVFCSHGTAPLGVVHSMVPMLRRKRLTLIGWGDWYGSVYQVLHAPKPYFTDGHPDEIDLSEAEAFGREMAERALRVAAGETELIPAIPKGPDADLTFQPHPMLADLREAHGLTYLIISHDLAMLYHLTTQIAVMYMGKIVEMGDTEGVFRDPLHPYTRALFAAIPRPVPGRVKECPALLGEISDPLNPPPGCRFYPRCTMRREACTRESPPLEQVGNTHVVACLSAHDASVC